MGDVVPFRQFKFRCAQTEHDVELLLAIDEEIYVEFKPGEPFATSEGRRYRRINSGTCEFWGY